MLKKRDLKVTNSNFLIYLKFTQKLILIFQTVPKQYETIFKIMSLDKRCALKSTDCIEITIVCQENK